MSVVFAAEPPKTAGERKSGGGPLSGRSYYFARVYFVEAAEAAKTLAAARCVAFTQGPGHAPMPTTPRRQMTIARPRSAGT